MKSKILITITLVIAFIVLGPTLASAQKQSMEALNKEVFNLVNKHRKSVGLKPLVENETIAKEASHHSANMAAKKAPFGHEGFNGRSERLLKQVKNANATAENVAYSSYSAERVVNMWLHSPKHLKNIEGEYNYTGIGIAKGADGNLYYTQIFVGVY